LDELINVHKVDVVRLPDSVLAELKSYSKEAIAEIAASDPMAKKVNESFEKFQKVIGPWGEISEKPYYETLADRYPLKG
jgi:TRAP-type mannitol/chloroaromatic compound transport system substrate-binding protein